MTERPNPVQWLWYAVGGRLPASLQDWVLRDVSARTWVWRPVALCLLVPGPLGLRAAMALLVVIVGTYFSLSYVEEASDMRAVKHGHAPGAAKAVRDARHEQAEAGIRARYEANFR
jgi:Family of unknown function (DUF5313)